MNYSKYLLLVMALIALGKAQQRAQAPFDSRVCFCQCSDLTFLDKYGNVQGNCRSSDHTGGRWCYVRKGYSRCKDLQYSGRFNGRAWSYEACSTPALNSPYCRKCTGYNC